MEMKTALVIAFGAAIGLPYVTIALLEGGGPAGPALVGGLFVGAILLVIWSDFGRGETSEDA
jgi:hypothetical protein